MEKETIELVKKMIEDGNLSQEIAEKYCPELKESKDDRIRKEIIRIVDIWTTSSPVVNGIPRETLLAWFEKQDEQKLCMIQMIKRFWYWLTRYKLSKEEYVIWLNIKRKAKRGFRVWYEETKGNDMCGPWIPDLTKEESRLLDRIYRKFHEGYLPSLSIGRGQLAYQIFDQIKHKVYY